MVNSSLLVVMEEIENVLEIYSNHPDWEVFASPQFRQKLINYVINRIQRAYPASEAQPNRLFLPKLPYRSLELRLRLENYIYEGINYILQTNSDLLPV
ncbi:MAG: hypothetical protein AB4426_16900 [Xenococcaceae cyanobacterium]